MSDVQFEDEDITFGQAGRTNSSDEPKGLMKLAMKLGAKTETQASYILIGFMVACLIATMYVISNYLL